MHLGIGAGGGQQGDARRHQRQADEGRARCACRPASRAAGRPIRRPARPCPHADWCGRPPAHPRHRPGFRTRCSEDRGCRPPAPRGRRSGASSPPWSRRCPRPRSRRRRRGWRYRRRRAAARRPARPHLVEKAEEDRLLDRPARRRRGDQQRHRLPGAGRIHAAIKAGDLGRQMAGSRDPPAGSSPRRCTRHCRAKSSSTRRRREGIRLQMQAQHRDAWPCRSSTCAYR